MVYEFQIKTAYHTQMVNITPDVRRVIEKCSIKNGLCIIYIPHTTAGITINENADPDVVRDLTYELNKMVPWEDGYYHYERNSAAHLKASMMGFSQTVILHDGELLLGRWQDIYFCEFDGARTRTVVVKVIEG